VDGLLNRLGVELPVVQAGMGGGIADHVLAAAVSEAGGLGTLGMRGPAGLAEEMQAARRLTARPVAVNLLLPFLRPGHRDVVRDADVVVTFWGTPTRLGPAPWLHQCGSVDEARAAQAAGADAVIVQGVEAGGHVRGRTPAFELFGQVRAALPPDYPLLLAGGIADAADVRAALDAGATAAVAGTRFLMSPESRASEGYKSRLVAGEATVLTDLFGLGWPGTHRVLPNTATDRWMHHDGRGPRATRLLNALSAPLVSRLPDRSHGLVARLQSAAVPSYSPIPPVVGTPDRVLEVSPLYAGETVSRLHDLVPAAQIVRDLAG
jgi:NAD(P)H-dependent flavin oxidoreductase YrpB (nitropropane dioxygenase family)